MVLSAAIPQALVESVVPLYHASPGPDATIDCLVTLLTWTWTTYWNSQNLLQSSILPTQETRTASRTPPEMMMVDSIGPNSRTFISHLIKL